ncbi:MAG: chromate transporter [Clostridia bacterium]|nr:chromate transporter [Clostridia bacterium]
MIGELFTIFFTFFKIGLFTFGGGYATIPLIREEVLTNGWLTEGEFLNFIAVAESTPGPIAVNMATFVGSSQHDILGAIVATLGVILPSFIIILIIASVLQNVLKLAGVKWALNGIKPTVAGLIIATGITMFLTVIFGVKTVSDSFDFNWVSLVIFGVVAITSILVKLFRKKELSPIILIIISAVLGIILYSI